MATVINNPPQVQTSNEGASAGLIIGIVIAVLAIFAFIVYGLPALRDRGESGTNINVPDRINVDVNGGQNGGY